MALMRSAPACAPVVSAGAAAYVPVCRVGNGDGAAGTKLVFWNGDGATSDCSLLLPFPLAVLRFLADELRALEDFDAL